MEFGSEVHGNRMNPKAGICVYYIVEKETWISGHKLLSVYVTPVDESP